MTRILQRPTIYPYRAADTGRWSWAIDRELIVRIGPDGEGVELIVPATFTSDLGSIPAPLRWLFNPADPQCAVAYLVHDYVLSLLARDEPTDPRPPWLQNWSSQVAAGLLYELLALEGVARWSRKAQFAGVLLGIARAEW